MPADPSSFLTIEASDKGGYIVSGAQNTAVTSHALPDRLHLREQVVNCAMMDLFAFNNR